jgi:hypothetical protein
MTDPIPYSDPMVQIAECLDYVVDALYGVTMTLAAACADGRCDDPTNASVTETLLGLVDTIENTRKNLGSE